MLFKNCELHQQIERYFSIVLLRCAYEKRVMKTEFLNNA